MPYNFVTNIESCYLNIPQLLYYSHIPTAVISLLLGIFVFANNRKSISAKLLLIISILFSLWSLSDIIIFVSPDSRMVMFFWSIVNLIEILASIATFYFAYTFFNKEKDPPFWAKLFFGAIVVSFAVIIPTQINLQSFDILNCESMQGSLINYFYLIEIFNFLCLFIYSIVKIIKTFNTEARRQVLLFSFGIILFSASFAGANLFGSFSALINPNDPNNWKILQYGLFGMPIFMTFLAYLIVRYKTFNIKLIATQALVWGLVILIGSQFFFIKVPVNFILNGFTFIASIIFGYLLTKSVKKEIEAKENEKLQHQKFEELANRFENVNHILAHDVKNVIGKNRDMFVEILAGTFGEVTDQGKDFLKRLATDTSDLITSVMNILKSGDEIKPEFKPFDFKEAVLDVIASVKDKANKEKIKIEIKIDESQNYTVNADSSLLTQHVLKNIIENAVNYNIPDGSILINLSKKDPKTIFLTVKDTGWGMTEEDKKILFKPGGHGPDSIKKNVHTSGFGLFIAKQTMDAHHGKIYGISDGRNKGSIFFVELPTTQE